MSGGERQPRRGKEKLECVESDEGLGHGEAGYGVSRHDEVVRLVEHGAGGGLSPTRCGSPQLRS